MGMIWKGLQMTLIISVGAAALGMLIGTAIALIKLQPKTRAFIVPKAICDVYVTVIRGTPMALQLFIMAFVVFAIRGFPQVVTAIIAFGLNSAAAKTSSTRNPSPNIAPRFFTRRRQVS